MSEATRLGGSAKRIYSALAIKRIFQIKPVDSEEIILKATVSVPDKAIQSNTIITWLRFEVNRRSSGGS